MAGDSRALEGRTFFKSILLAGLIVSPIAASGHVELFVASATFQDPSITVFDRAAGGDVPPFRSIRGPATGLDLPRGVAVDVAHEEILVSDAGTSDSIFVFPRAANGDVAPIRTITGPTTGLVSPAALVLDLVHDEILVVNAGSVVVHARTASGNATPLRRIAGPGTGLSGPLGLVLDLAHDEIIVANGAGDSVTVYPRTATGATPPIRRITGPATGLDFPRGLALDPINDQIIVGNQSGGLIMAFPRTANGDVAPVRTLAGAATGLNFPFGLVVDPVSDELIVMNNHNGAVTASISAFLREAEGNASPIRILTVATTGLRAMQAIAIAGPSAPALISTGTGPTGGPHVKLFHFDPTAAVVTQLGGGFFAYDPGFTGGVQATVIRVQGSLYLVTGVGSGGGPHIKLFKVTDLATGAVTPVGGGFFAYDPGFTGGARVAATTDAAGNLLIITGVGSGGGAHVKVFQVTNLATGAVVQLGGGFFAYDPAFTGGVNVGAQ
jgi:hypothetical protein